MFSRTRERHFNRNSATTFTMAVRLETSNKYVTVKTQKPSFELNEHRNKREKIQMLNNP